jgi:hypothetical protein
MPGMRRLSASSIAAKGSGRINVRSVRAAGACNASSTQVWATQL